MIKTLKFDSYMKKITRIIGVVLLYFGLQILLDIYYFDLFTSSIEWVSGAAELLIYLLIICIFALIYLPTLVDNFKNFKSSYLGVGLEYWIKGLALMMVSNIILSNFIVGTISNNESLNREVLSSTPVISIILMVFVAPILEELVFRLGIRKQINNKLTFCLVSAFLFGAVHCISSTRLIELLYIIPYGCLGFYLAKGYSETNNIYTSMFMHMFHNGFAIIAILLAGLL